MPELMKMLADACLQALDADDIADVRRPASRAVYIPRGVEGEQEGENEGVKGRPILWPSPSNTVAPHSTIADA